MMLERGCCFVGRSLPRGFPIAEALSLGADVVVTGRCVDSALTLGPLIHQVSWGGRNCSLVPAVLFLVPSLFEISLPPQFQWREDDFDLLAAGRYTYIHTYIHTYCMSMPSWKV